MYTTLDYKPHEAMKKIFISRGLQLNKHSIHILSVNGNK